MIEALEQLGAALQRAGSPAAALLAPGLDDLSVANGLPEELVALHRWHDGLTGDGAPEQELFPGGYWLSLGRAMEQRAARLRLAADAVTGTDLDPELLWRAAWLPVFVDFAGNAHVVVCDTAGAPVWFVAGDDLEDRRPAFDGIGALVRTLTEAWSSGAFRAGAGGVEADEAAYAAIHRRHNAVQAPPVDPGSPEALRIALATGDGRARADSARRLGALRDKPSGELLTAAIGDPDPDVRIQAIAAVGTLRLKPAIDAVIGALTDADLGVRISAARTLGVFKSPLAVPALVAALGDPARDVRQLAADALARVKDPAARAAVEGLLDDEDPLVRAIAARAVGG